MKHLVKSSTVKLFWCVCVFQELECLQDHLDDLGSDCRDVVGNLTELESEVRNTFVL